MVAAYSMDGFDILERDGILEMRTSGVRQSHHFNLTTGLVGRFIDDTRSRMLMQDMREAHYPGSPLLIEERTRAIARQLAAFTVACVIRPDQLDIYTAFRKAHRERGGKSCAFASLEEARRWLKSNASDSALSA